MRECPHRSATVTRRDALRRIGAAGMGIVAAPGLTAAHLTAARRQGGSDGVTFPDGAIIRTVLRDIESRGARRRSDSLPRAPVHRRPASTLGDSRRRTPGRPSPPTST